jgi:pimeloyl-ACP methyl ester carboxylesterase
LRALINWSVSQHLPEIDCPTLIVSADADYTPVSLKEAYAARMPRAEVKVIENSRHLTPVDQPVRFNETLMAFLLKYS